MYQSSKATPNKPRMEFIVGISQFKSTYRPIASKLNERNLLNKISVEKQSTAATSERIHNNKYYLEYESNPFSNYKFKKGKFSNNSYSSTRTKSPLVKKNNKNNYTTQEERSLVDQMDKMNSSLDKIISKKIKKMDQIQEMIIQCDKTSQKIMYDVDKKTSAKSFQVQMEEKASMPKLESTVQKKTKQIKKQLDYPASIKLEEIQRIQNAEVDDIISIKQPCFYFNEDLQKFNIFKFPYDKQQCPNLQQMLQERRFSFDGIIQKISKAKVPLVRDISRISRTLIRKPVPQNDLINVLQNQELSLKQNNIGFVQVMSFASGRIQPDFINKINQDNQNYMNNEVSDTSSEINDEIKIIYKKYQQNYGRKFEGEKEQKQEIHEYANIEPTKQQQQTYEECRILREKIRQIIQQKQFVQENRVMDLQVHEGQQKMFKKLLMDNFFDEALINQPINKIVQHNKTKKDKKEIIKLKNFIDTLNNKKKKNFTTRT